MNKIMYITHIDVPDLAYAGSTQLPSSVRAFCKARKYNFLKCWDSAKNIQTLIQLIRQHEYDYKVMFDMFMEMFVYLAKNNPKGYKAGKYSKTISKDELANYVTAYEQSVYPSRPACRDIWDFTFRRMIEFYWEGNHFYFEDDEPQKRVIYIMRNFNALANKPRHTKELVRIMKRHIMIIPKNSDNGDN